MAIEKFNGKFSKQDSGCTIVINETIRNITDFAVIGLYVYLSTRPPEWRINPKEIMHHSGNSKDKTYRLLNKLIELRLLKSIPVRENGRYVSFDYILYLEPYPENKEMVSDHINTASAPFPEKQDPEKQDPENQDAYITKRNTKQREYKTNKDLSCEKKKKQPAFSSFEYQDTYYQTPVSKENSTPSRFEEFWSLYPNKKNKNRARCMWENSNLDEKADFIFDKLKTQIEEDQHWQLLRYIPNPANYINDERWKDEITKIKNADNKQNQQNKTKHNWDINNTDWIYQ